jgi:8-oxo-dGTP pyrophosphatase MutT (NUDIX family)
VSETKKVGPFTRKGRYVHQYPGMLTEVRVDDVERPDGSPGTYVTAKVKNGALVLAVDDDGTCYLTKQFRYAVEKETVEVAAGGADAGEAAVDAARRELREELGIEAERWEHLGTLHPVASLLEMQEDLFLARGLSFTERDLDRGEKIEVLKLPLEELEAMAVDGRLVAPSSVVLVFRALRILKT